MQEFLLLPTLPSLLSAPTVPLIHRDLSWLQFNERVMAEARDKSNPLLERAKFLAISAANLDEFFMIRFASLNRTLRGLMRGGDDVGLRRQESIRDNILESVARFGARQVEVFDSLVDELATAGIQLVKRADESATALALGRAIFEKEVFPKLAPPETFDNVVVTQVAHLQMAAIFPGRWWFLIPRTLPAVYSAPDPSSGRTYYFFLDDLLTTFLGATFGLQGEVGLIRLTRDADFTVEVDDDDPASIPDMVLSGIGSRERAAGVRLQYRGNLGDSVLSQLGAALRLVPAQILPAAGSLVLHGLWSVFRGLSEERAAAAGLRYPTLNATVPWPFAGGEDIFSRVRRQDFLFHHPYDSFDAFVAWVRAAAEDPQVEMIEQTVYRMDPSCPLIDVLKGAAARKRVRVVIELRARFDEMNNLRLADELRRAGVEVAYGFGKLKLHAKITLVTRREGNGTRWYTHLSTGNYNATTARLYTDLGILTSQAEIGADARHFFDSVWDGKLPTGFKRLVSAPARLHRRLLSLIEGETEAALLGRRTRIVAKVNALVDEAVIDALYRASRAGVQVDLIVRGACSLIPGIKDLSENIRVISIVDRFLEHSRLYYFEDAKALYLSSADWMPRNFFSRLEIAFPVLDPRIYQYIAEVLLPTYLSDSVKARELTSQGLWKRRVNGSKRLRSQFVFESLATRHYRGTPLAEPAEPGRGLRAARKELHESKNPDHRPPRSPRHVRRSPTGQRIEP